MTDTAQPMAAETDAFADAASAFKVALGQEEAPAQPRNDKGQFASAAPEEAEEPEQGVPGDDTLEETVEQETDEAAEEAQPEAVAMPTSWTKEDGELWEALPVEAQARIAEREAQRDQAVGQKFQEAANARKVYEAVAQEASSGREEAAQLIGQVMNLLVGEAPPVSMLDPMSSDYAPDQYHLLKAQHEQNGQLLQNLHRQRQELIAQADAEAQRLGQIRVQEINSRAAPALLKDVPDFGDAAKQQQAMTGLIEYAMGMGAPADVFQSPLSAMEWHVLWKAQQWDNLSAVKAKANTTPPPQPRKAAPPVRPGVTAPRSTVQKQARNRDFEALAQSGSIEDGARMFKHFLR